MKAPENPSGFERCEADGVSVFVQGGLMPGSSGPLVLKFYFGMFGDCRIFFDGNG